MDPISLALVGLNLGAKGYDFYEQGRLNRAQGAYGNAQGEAEVRSAENAQAQLQDDMRRKRRMLQESLASRGVEDSTIASDDMNYLNQGDARSEQGAADRVNLAHKGLALFHKQMKSKRRGNNINMGVGLANALGGAYAGINAAPGLPSNATGAMSGALSHLGYGLH